MDTVILSEQAANEQGYAALTVSYILPREQSWLDNVVNDMRRGRVDYVLVNSFRDGSPAIEVWLPGLRLS